MCDGAYRSVRPLDSFAFPSPAVACAVLPSRRYLARAWQRSLRELFTAEPNEISWTDVHSEK
jgi:hypothetical protein